MAGTYYFFTSNRALAYDYDDSNNVTRNSSKDRNLANDLSGVTVNIRGATATENRIALLNADKKLYLFDHDWNRVSGEDVTLNTSSRDFYEAVCATNNRWVVSNIQSTRVEFWTFAGSEQTRERHSIGSFVNGLFSDDTYIYYIINNGNVQRRTYTNTSLSTFILSLGGRVPNAWRGAASTSTRFVFVNESTDVSDFYNHSGTLQSSEQISLPSGAYQAVMAVEENSATITISTTDTNIEAGETVNFNIQSDIDISDFSAGDVTVTNGTRGTLTRTDARNYVLSVVAGSAGRLRIAIAEDVVSPGNTAVSQDFTITAVRADLSVTISGTKNIVQGARTTLTAAVTDAGSNAVTSGLTYAWTASRGRFIGATDEASAVYEANFTDSSNVEVTITCAVTLAENPNPTLASASLTSLSDIGVTGVLVNMFMTALGAVVSNSNNTLYQDGSVGTLAAGSDQVLSSDITIWRVRWNNDSNRIILNNNQTGSLQTYFTANTDKSLYVVFEDGTYVELPQSALVSTGTTWAQWSVTDANIIAKLNALTTTSDLLIGIADGGSIGFERNSGSGTATVTARPAPPSAPDAPANFRGTVTHNSATVLWDSVNGVTYEVRQGSNTWVDATSPHVFSGLSASTAYRFQVRVKASGSTPAGNIATVNLTTEALPHPDPPAAPTNFSETHTHNSAVLTWTALAGETYEVRQGSNAWGDATTPHSVSGLSPSTAYTYQVRVKAKGRTPAGEVAELTFTTDAPPLVAPSIPASLSATAVDHNTIRLVIGVSTGTVTQRQYRYATSTAALATAIWQNASATTIDVDGLSPSTTYYFQARAGNQGVYSAASTTASATTQGVPTSVPVISKLQPQFVLVGTDFDIQIPISEKPTVANMRGSINGSSTHLDRAMNILHFRGNIDRLLSDQVALIHARNIVGDAVPVPFIYSVIPLAPIIKLNLDPLLIVPGSLFEVLIPVQNVQSADVTGLYMGLDQETLPDDHAVRIFGTVPMDAFFGVERGTFTITADYPIGPIVGTADFFLTDQPMTFLPDTPTGFTADGSVGNGTVRLTWLAVASAASYEVSVGVGGWQNVGNVLTYDVTGLMTGVTQSFYVRSVDDDGIPSRATEPVMAFPV